MTEYTVYRVFAYLPSLGEARYAYGRRLIESLSKDLLAEAAKAHARAAEYLELLGSEDPTGWDAGVERTALLDALADARQAMANLEEALCVTDGERLRASYRCDRRNDAKGRYRPWDSAEG